MSWLYPRKTLFTSPPSPKLPSYLDFPNKLFNNDILVNDLLVEFPGLDRFSIYLKDESKSTKTPPSYCGRVGVGFQNEYC
jgi:hypothetical protein